MPWFWENREEYERRYTVKRNIQRIRMEGQHEVRVLELAEDRFDAATDSILITEKDRIFTGTEKWVIICFRGQYFLLYEYQYWPLLPSDDAKNSRIPLNLFDRIAPIEKHTAPVPVRNNTSPVSTVVVASTTLTNIQLELSRMSDALREQAVENQKNAAVIKNQEAEIVELRETIAGLKRDYESMIGRVASCEAHHHVPEREMDNMDSNEETSATRNLICDECGESKPCVVFRVRPLYNSEKKKKPLRCNACRSRLYRDKKKTKIGETV